MLCWIFLIILKSLMDAEYSPMLQKVERIKE